MKSVQVEKTTHYDIHGKLEPPQVSGETLSLPDFVVCGYIRELHTAAKSFGVVPPRHVFNGLFRVGQAGDNIRWEPFELTEREYNDLSREIIARSDGYCIEDESLWEHRDYDTWRRALVDKVRGLPDYKPLSWMAQNDEIGIPIGEGKWIQRERNLIEQKATRVDDILLPLRPFFFRLEHCSPYCCNVAAYDFLPESVLEQADTIGRQNVVRLLDHAIIDLDELDAAATVVSSEMLNTKLTKHELLTLLEHLVSVLSRKEAL